MPGSSVAFTALPLDDPEELSKALVRLEILTHEPAVAPHDFTSAQALQRALSRAFAAAAAQSQLPARDVETINSFAADETPAVRLTQAGSVLRVATEPVACALSALARDGAEIIASRAADLRRCRSCEAPFLDESRGRRRRWCSMERCGNRAKVAAYRSRRQR